MEEYEYRMEIEYKLDGTPIHYLVPTQREPIPAGVRCKFCGSRDLVRYGKYNNVQRYLCKDCGKKSADNDTMPRKRIPPHVVGAALSMFYEGMSFLPPYTLCYKSYEGRDTSNPDFGHGTSREGEELVMPEYHSAFPPASLPGY